MKFFPAGLCKVKASTVLVVTTWRVLRQKKKLTLHLPVTHRSVFGRIDSLPCCNLQGILRLCTQNTGGKAIPRVYTCQYTHMCISFCVCVCVCARAYACCVCMNMHCMRNFSTWVFVCKVSEASLAQKGKNTHTHLMWMNEIFRIRAPLFCPAYTTITEIYYWSKWKRRNYSRYNRYQKCCVRKLWDQLLNIYNYNPSNWWRIP